MRAHLRLLVVIALCSDSVLAAPLSRADRAIITQFPARFTAGWLHNSRDRVMGLFATDAVFIPHDGVKPRRGWRAIDQFWFPKAGTAGRVTAFEMPVDSVAGDDRNAILWGRSDLHWQDATAAYRWRGYYLMALRREQSGWRITHFMSSDEQPAKTPLARR